MAEILHGNDAMFRLGTTESTLFILWLSLLCFCENVTSKALQNITASSVDVPESSPHNHYYHERPKVVNYFIFFFV